MGWFPDADLDGVDSGVDCEPNSDLRPTVNIESCDSGVPNTLFTNGCTISDLIAQVAASSNNHGQFVAGVARLTAALVSDGVITNAQKDAILACAGASTLP